MSGYEGLEAYQVPSRVFADAVYWEVPGGVSVSLLRLAGWWSVIGEEMQFNDEMEDWETVFLSREACLGVLQSYDLRMQDGSRALDLVK